MYKIVSFWLLIMSVFNAFDGVSTTATETRLLSIKVISSKILGNTLVIINFRSLSQMSCEIYRMISALHTLSNNTLYWKPVTCLRSCIFCIYTDKNPKITGFKMFIFIYTNSEQNILDTGADLSSVSVV